MQRRTGSPHSSCRCNRTVVPKGPLSIRSSRFSQSVVHRSCRCNRSVVPKGPLSIRSSRFSQSVVHRSCRCNRSVVPKGPLSIRSSRFSQSVVPQGTLTPRSCRRCRRTSRCIYPVVPQSPLAVRGPAEAQGLPAVGSSGLSPRSSPAMHRRRLEGSRAGRSGLRTDGRALELGGVAEDAGSVRRTTYDVL